MSSISNAQTRNTSVRAFQAPEPVRSEPAARSGALGAAKVLPDSGPTNLGGRLMPESGHIALFERDAFVQEMKAIAAQVAAGDLSNAGVIGGFLKMLGGIQVTRYSPMPSAAAPPSKRD
jgi:hypothetical protein